MLARRVACVWCVACGVWLCGADKNQAKIDASVPQARAPLGLVFNLKGSAVVAPSAIRALQSSLGGDVGVVRRAGSGAASSRERHKSARQRASGAKAPNLAGTIYMAI